MKKKNRLRLLLSSCLAVALLTSGVMAGQMTTAGNDKGNKPFKKIIHLAASSVEPRANGIAKVMAKTKGKAKQEFQVVGSNLKASTTYRLFVNGVEIDSQTAESEGEGEPNAAVEFHYSSKAKEGNSEGLEPLPAALNPVTGIRRVELKDASGAVALSGEFSAS